MILAFVAGACVSLLTAPASDSRPAAERVVRAGAAEVIVPGAWRPAALGSARLPGLDAKRSAVLTPWPGASPRAVVMTYSADDPSLIPGVVRDVLAAPPPRPRDSSLGGRPAWHYPRLDIRAPDSTTMDLTVLPTTAGVLAVVCVAPASSPGLASVCASAVRSGSMRGAATMIPSAVAFAARLRRVLASLESARVRGRAALRRAETGVSQALQARRLAAGHFSAAGLLEPVEGASQGQIVRDLVTTGRAYAALGRAARDGSVARFDAARHRVRATGAELARAVADALEAPARGAVPAPVTSSAAAPGPMPTSAARLGGFLLVIFVVAGPAAAGFVLSGPLATATARVARAARRLADA